MRGLGGEVRRRRLLSLPIGYFFIALLLLLSTACRPVEQPTQTADLPAPRLHMITRTSPAASLPPPTQVEAAPERHKTTPGSLEELARQTYGKRLVEWIRIPKLNLLAPVTPVGWQSAGDKAEWDSPDAQVGWAVSSALPGDSGNVILYGHNNIDSSVFMHLGDLQPGDRIQLTTGQKDWMYQVTEVKIIPVLNDEENQNAYEVYFRDTGRAQLTVLSCWPPVSNTHRVIVMALPVEQGKNK